MDPGISFRGLGGGPGPTVRKQSGPSFFFLFFSFFFFLFLVLNLFTVYRVGPMFLLQRKLYFSKDPEGVQHFPGGPTFFLVGGPNANFYRNPYIL